MAENNKANGTKIKEPMYMTESPNFEVVAVHLGAKTNSFTNVAHTQGFVTTRIIPDNRFGGRIAPALIEFTPKVAGWIKTDALELLTPKQVLEHFALGKDRLKEPNPVEKEGDEITYNNDNYDKIVSENRYKAVYLWAIINKDKEVETKKPTEATFSK